MPPCEEICGSQHEDAKSEKEEICGTDREGDDEIAFRGNHESYDPLFSFREQGEIIVRPRLAESYRIWWQMMWKGR